MNKKFDADSFSWEQGEIFPVTMLGEGHFEKEEVVKFQQSFKPAVKKCHPSVKKHN